MIHKSLTVYLTSWQQRMVEDLLGKKAKKLVIPLEKASPVPPYGVPTVAATTKYQLMYFTDEQMNMINSELKIKGSCNFIEIGKDLPLLFQ
jgi:hypothetical protein